MAYLSARRPPSTVLTGDTNSSATVGNPADSGGVPWLCEPASRRGCLVEQIYSVADRIDIADSNLDVPEIRSRDD